jgi:hypothetical protein
MSALGQYLSLELAVISDFFTESFLATIKQTGLTQNP